MALLSPISLEEFLDSFCLVWVLWLVFLPWILGGVLPDSLLSFLAHVWAVYLAIQRAQKLRYGIRNEDDFRKGAWMPAQRVAPLAINLAPGENHRYNLNKLIERRSNEKNTYFSCVINSGLFPLAENVSKY